MISMETVLRALGAPRRRDILRIVRRRERSAGDIHRALGDVTFGAVSQHLGVLERAGLVTARREGRSRLYQARPEGLEPLKEWLESMWDQALASLKALAEAEEARARKSRRRAALAERAGRRRREPRERGDKR
jgi:DNA-binding transcriptional ArsR family regulator